MGRRPLDRAGAVPAFHCPPRLVCLSCTAMAIEFPAALKLVREIAAIAKQLAETRDEFKLNEISIKLQRRIIDLHNEITLIQSAHQTALREQDELKKKLSEKEQWNEISSRYRLE